MIENLRMGGIGGMPKWVSHIKGSGHELKVGPAFRFSDFHVVGSAPVKKGMLKELMLDNLGICRFHRAWAETLLLDVVENPFGEKEAFLRSINLTASRITRRNASVF